MKASESAREAAASVCTVPGYMNLEEVITQAEARGRIAGIREAAAVADEHAEAWGLAHATPAIAIATAILALIPGEPK